MSTFTVSTIANLRENQAAQAGDFATVTAVPGTFLFDATSTEADDGETYIKPYDVRNDAAGRWVKQLTFATL